MDKAKRKRTPNFSAEEKMKFVRLLREEGRCIISKVTAHDSSTNKEKESAWKKITLIHNSGANITRTTDTLKKLWGKLKSDAKTFKAASRRSVSGTGGGPSVKFEDPVLELVADMTGRGSTGVLGIVDCDAVVSTNNTENDEFSNAVQADDDDEYLDFHHLDESIFLEDGIPDDKIIVINEKVEEINDRPPTVISESKEEGHNRAKRRRPILTTENERTENIKKRAESSNRFAKERLRAEQEKSALILQQKNQMTELHAIKMENEKLKKELLHTLLKKVLEADSKDVALEAANFVLK